MVTIEVGPYYRLFRLHKGLLISRCGPSFSGAFDELFEKNHAGVLSLPEEDASSFELFVDWVYVGSIPPIPVKKAWNYISVDEMKVAGLFDTESAYHKVYYLADMWCIPNLKNQALDCIRAFHTRTVTLVHPELVEQGYANTAKGSLLRSYLMRAAAFSTADLHNDEEYFREFVDQPTSNVVELMADIMGVLKEDYGAAKDPDSRHGCDYHEPVVDGKKCCS